MLSNHFEFMTDNANINALPPADNRHLAKEGWQITIGDLHANTMKLIYMLCRHGVMEDISEENYKALLNIYQKEESKILTDDLETFTKILKQTRFNKSSLVRLLGSEMANKGNNDFLTLTVLKRMHDEGIKVEILLSNYGFELIRGYENYIKTNEEKSFDSTQLDNSTARSLHNFSRLIKNKKITAEKAIDVIKSGYLPSLKLLSYGLSSDKTTITLYSHAPIDISTIKSLSKKLDQPFNDSTALALAQTIDAINLGFQKHVMDNSLTSILNVDLVNKAGLKQEEVSPDTHPMEFIMLNNSTSKLKQMEEWKGFKINFVHGRIDPNTNQDNTPNVTNLNTALGKGFLSNGEYSALYTQEHQCNSEQETKRKATAENERKTKENAERIAKEEAGNKEAKEEAARKATVDDQQKANEESDHKRTPGSKSEKELADQATENFRTALNNSGSKTPLYKAGLNLLNTVNNCKKLDDNYRHRLMVAAKNLHEQPGNVVFQNNYANILEDNTDGKRSIPGIIFGAVISFLGAAIIGASIALGITLIGMPLASGGILIGAYVMTVGLALLINNRQKGTQQALIDYQHTLFKSHSLSLPPSQTQHSTLTK